MKFFLRFSSCRFFSVVGRSRAVIKLLDRLRILRLCRLLRFSIFRILLSCRSRTSRLGSSSKFSIVLMKFLLSIITRRFEEGGNWLSSYSLLWETSRKVRFGKLTMFSIFVISFWDKLSYLSFSSPSSNGTCFSPRLSKLSFSEFWMRSVGRR